MKALLVDDERLARTELRRLLAAHPQITIVGEAENGNQALERIAELKPDLLFMDIQMPGKTGFEVVQALGPARPEIIFTTAYDAYAIRAFEFAATDYLLKPVDPERLRQAISKLHQPAVIAPGLESGEESDDDFESQHTGHAAHGEKLLSGEDQVFIKDGEKCYFIRLEKVRLFESIGNYVRVHFDGGKPMILRSLNALEERLDPGQYFRTNRKHIVNLKMVEQVEPYFSGGLMLKLQGGEKIEVSRRQAARFKELLSL